MKTRSFSITLAVACLNACAAFAMYAAVPLATDDRIGRSELVSPSAMGFYRIDGRDAFAEREIGLVGFRLDMTGVAASMVFAQMVNLVSVWDGSDEFLVNQPVDIGHLCANSDSAIAIPVSCPRPVPATGVIVYNHAPQKSVNRRVMDSHVGSWFGIKKSQPPFSYPR